MSWIERPPRLLTAITVLWFALVVFTFSDAGVPFPTWLGVSAFSVALSASCIVRLLIAFSQGRREGMDWLRRHSRWCVSTLALLVSGFILAATSPLLSARIYFSQEVLRQSGPALSAIPQADLFTEGRQVGLFRVREFSQFESELRFLTNECGLVDFCGIVFSPDGPPPNRGEDSFSHLYGPWWHWYRSW